MGRVLQTIAVIYLLLAWGWCAYIFIGISQNAVATAALGVNAAYVQAILIGVATSAFVTAALLFAFGQIVSDARTMRNQLGALLRLARREFGEREPMA